MKVCMPPNGKQSRGTILLQHKYINSSSIISPMLAWCLLG